MNNMPNSTLFDSNVKEIYKSCIICKDKFHLQLLSYTSLWLDPVFYGICEKQLFVWLVKM